MIKSLKYIMLSALVTACAGNTSVPADDFQYNDERFADLQMLRYKVDGFDSLTLKQKTLIYHLSEAALYGRDILFDQNGKYNLRIMRTLETVYTDFAGDKQSEDFKALEVYLKRVWFSAGIHHHYGSEKFVPGFSEKFFRSAVKNVDPAKLPLEEGQTVDELLAVICPVMFDPTVMPKSLSLEGEDLLLASANNYYEGVTQAEAEALAEYLAASADSINCVVIQPKEGESIPKSVQEIHAALKRYNIPTTSTTIREILVDSVGDAFVMDKENIVIFNTEKYSNLQAVMPHLLQAVGTHRITLLSRYSWQNEKIVLPQIYTSVFYEELVSPEAYEELYATYFDTKPSAQSPRYDLLGYDLTKHFIELLQSSDTTLLSEDWIGVQSAIQYQPSSVHAGYENKKISVIRK